MYIVIFVTVVLIGLVVLFRLKSKSASKLILGVLSLSNNGRDQIVSHEGIRNKAYKDVGGKWTIGIGHLIKDNEKHLITTVLSDQDVYNIFNNDIKYFEDAVNRLVTVPMSQNMFDALVSFTFNLGEGNLTRSTLLKLLNGGATKNEVANEFIKWVKVNGVPNDGLKNRRMSESKLFLS